MADSNFYENKGPFSITQILNGIDSKFIGDKNFLVYDVSTLALSNEKHLSFFSNKKYINELKCTKAGVIIVEEKFIEICKTNIIVSNHPYYTFAQIVNKFYPNTAYPDLHFDEDNKKKFFSKSNKISFSAFVHKNASLGENISIGLNSVIGPGVKIGNNCKIADNVSIYFSNIAENVKINSGSRIGSDGFGFAIKDNTFLKIPQIGRVLINENVEIGANVTIDRGSAGDTIIKRNSMIDNLVHIAHNVEIGNNCIIAAMTGISGSTKIGNNVVIGGQVGFSGHNKIGDNTKIAAKSGIFKDVSANTSVGGFPAQPIRDWHRTNIYLKNKVKNDKKT